MTPRRAKPADDEPNQYRTLPHNLEAEKAVLGGIIINNAQYVQSVTLLRAGHFFRRAHASIFLAIGRLLDEQKRDVDLLTLKDELTRVGELDECGGPAYISSLTDGVPRSSNVGHYARIVLEKAQLRAVIKLGNVMLTDAYDAEQPSTTIINAADKAIVDLQRGVNEGRLVDLRQSHAGLYEDLEWREQHRGQLIGVDTGFASINELTLGWQPGELIVLAARPSVGKTAFMLHTALSVALQSKMTVGVFSLEMLRRQLEYRMLASRSGIPLSRLQGGYLGEVDYEKLSAAMADLSQAPIFIDDRGGQTVLDIRAECRRLRAEHGLGLVIIDYVQLIPGTIDRRGATRTEEVTDISRRLKLLTNEVQAPILLLSQLSRAGEKEGRRPRLSDLRESGSLEQDADKVVFLHRRHHLESGVTNVIFEKDRNGPGGVLNVTFDRDRQQFTDGGEEPKPEAKPEPAEKKPRRRRNAPFADD